jgi:hypothetical protein
MPAKLPKSLIILKNSDKEFHEKWEPNRDPLNFPHPFRAVLSGPPNSGKTMTILNVAVRADKAFEKIIVVHQDAEMSCEYDDLDVEMRSDIPSTAEHTDNELKTLIIVDDVDFSLMSKEDLKNLDRLVGYDSTHKNISVIITSQTFTRLPTIVRKCANVFVLWKVDDKDQVQLLARRTNTDLKRLFDNHIKTRFDAIWIDKTVGSPYPIRLNGYQMLV